MPTRHVHRDEASPSPSPGYSPLAAYARLVASLVGAVLVTTILWATMLVRQFEGVAMWYSQIPHDIPTYVSTLWRIDATGYGAVDLGLLAIAYLASPWVLGVIVVAGIVTCVIAGR